MDFLENKIDAHHLGKTLVSYHSDYLGHDCLICKFNKKVFVEIPNNKTIRICKDCIYTMNYKLIEFN